MACPVELRVPPVLDYYCRSWPGKIVGTEGGSPFRELDVSREYHAAPLVAARHHLEEQLRAFHVERHVSELVEYHLVVFAMSLSIASSPCSRRVFERASASTTAV